MYYSDPDKQRVYEEAVRSGCCIIDKRGEKGPLGPTGKPFLTTGMPGERGPKGPKGFDGIAGRDGSSVTIAKSQITHQIDPVLNLRHYGAISMNSLRTRPVWNMGENNLKYKPNYTDDFVKLFGNNITLKPNMAFIPSTDGKYIVTIRVSGTLAGMADRYRRDDIKVFVSKLKLMQNDNVIDWRHSFGSDRNGNMIFMLNTLVNLNSGLEYHAELEYMKDLRDGIRRNSQGVQAIDYQIYSFSMSIKKVSEG